MKKTGKKSKNVSYVGKTSGKQDRNIYSLGMITKNPSLGKQVGLDKMEDSIKKRNKK